MPRLPGAAREQANIRYLSRTLKIRRRHFIRATKERLRKRDRPLVPRRRNPLCVCPWGNPKGGTPFGAPFAMCQIDCSKGRTRGTPKECLLFLCLCASCSHASKEGSDSTYKSAGGTLSGTTKERLRKQACPLACAAATRCLFARRGSQRGFAPLAVFSPFLLPEMGPARRAKRVWGHAP